jgi:transposase
MGLGSKKCPNCGKRISESRRKYFCSAKCMHEWLWKKGHDLEELKKSEGIKEDG